MNNDIIVEFLDKSGMELLANPVNYELYATIKAALKADNKPTFCVTEVDTFIPSQKPIETVEDVFQSQGQLLNAMLECYLKESTYDLCETLFDEANINLSLMVEGLDTITCEIYVNNESQTSLMEDEDVKTYIGSLDDEIKQTLLEILTDWKNTFELAVPNSDVWFLALGMKPTEQAE